MKQIEQDIKGNTYKSLYLLYGEEDFLRQQMKYKLKEAIVGNDESMNYAYYEGKKTEFKDVIAFADTMPFFAEKRLVIVENVLEKSKSAAKEEKGSSLEEWTAYLEHVPEHTCVVLVEKEIDKRSRIYKVCKKYGYVADLDLQKEEALVQWVKKWLAEHNQAMSDADIHYFLGRVTNQMSMIQNELEKLSSYCQGQPLIAKEQIDLLATQTVENRIFDMIDAATRADSLRAFQLYYDLLALKEAPMKILVLLTRQINIILQIKDHMRLRHANAEIAKEVGVPPFVVNKNGMVAKQISYQKLKQLLNIAVQLDEDIKLGKIKDNIAVEMLLTECCKTEKKKTV